MSLVRFGQHAHTGEPGITALVGGGLACRDKRVPERFELPRPMVLS
jgi:hypothetical protein